MRICFFSGGFSNVGGIGRCTSVILNALAEKGQNEYYSLQFIDKQNCQVYKLNERIKTFSLFSESTTMFKALVSKHLIKRIKNFIKANKIDIIVACGDLFFLPTVIAARQAKIKSVCWEHTNPKVTTDYKFQKYCRKFSIKRSSCNVVITSKALEFYETVKRDKTWLIYNPVDDALFKSETNYQPTTKKIVSVGRLCYAKNYELAIEIAQQVLSKYKDWSWEICGDGPDFQKLQDKIASTTVADRIILRGNVPDMYDRYGYYSFIVMTSRFEGFPMVLLEAAAKALPMVSFDIETGPSEIIDNGHNGYLIEKDNLRQMVDKISNLIENEEDRENFSRQAYITSKKFTASEMIKHWERLFEELLYG